MLSFGLNEARPEKFENAWLDVPGFTSVARPSVIAALPEKPSSWNGVASCKVRKLPSPLPVFVRNVD
jgi:hypothetical protein